MVEGVGQGQAWTGLPKVTVTLDMPLLLPCAGWLYLIPPPPSAAYTGVQQPFPPSLCEGIR